MWAAKNNHAHVVEYLLGKDVKGLDIDKRAGWVYLIPTYYNFAKSEVFLIE